MNLLNFPPKLHEIEKNLAWGGPGARPPWIRQCHCKSLNTSKPEMRIVYLSVSVTRQKNQYVSNSIGNVQFRRRNGQTQTLKLEVRMRTPTRGTTGIFLLCKEKYLP